MWTSDFAEFLQVIDNQKDRAAMYEDDSDMSASTVDRMLAIRSVELNTVIAVCCTAVDAFVACGGKTDKSGFVRKETLIKIIKGDFGLTINIEVSCLGSL